MHGVRPLTRADNQQVWLKARRRRCNHTLPCEPHRRVAGAAWQWQVYGRARARAAADIGGLACAL